MKQATGQTNVRRSKSGRKLLRFLSLSLSLPPYPFFQVFCHQIIPLDRETRDRSEKIGEREEREKRERNERGKRKKTGRGEEETPAAVVEVHAG